MADIQTVREHLASINVGANAVHNRLVHDDSGLARDFVELMRHVHHAINELADLIEERPQRR